MKRSRIAGIGVRRDRIRRARLRVTADGKGDTRRRDLRNPSSHRWVRHRPLFWQTPLHRYTDVSVSVGKMSTNRPKNADGVSSARAAGLRYANPDAPGITRKRRGKGFVYLDARGRRFATRRRSTRIRALVLPPAWTDVWISTDARAHLQATGRDAAGRKQYRYHADWTAERDSTKYHRMLAFAEVLPAIRSRTRRDLMGPACCRPRVLATVVELLARTYIRIGNEEYARKQQVAWLDDAAAIGTSRCAAAN